MTHQKWCIVQPIALKSVLEVELAKRNEATKINMDDIAECDIYE